MKNTNLIIASILFTSSLAFADAPKKHAFTPEDIWSMQRVSDPSVSPDGKQVVFTVKTIDMAANKGRTDVWIANVDGTSSKPLVDSQSNDDSAVFSPDGKKVFFLSTRSGSSQVWELPVKGGVAWQITNLPTDVNGFKVFPDGKTFLLSVDVYPEATDIAASVKQEEAEAKRPGNYKKYDRLLFRHWDTWEDGKRGHLFVYKNKNDIKDLMKGMDMDSPTHPFGGMEETAISPDGQTVVFAGRSDGNKAAYTNNVDLFAVSVSGDQAPQNITIGNAAWDDVPAFSPDGKTLAYLSMARPGFESDRTRITLMDWASKKITILTDKWDRSPADITWSKDGKTILTTADNLGSHSLFAVDTSSGDVKTLNEKGESGHPDFAGDKIVYSFDNLVSPAELWTMNKDGSNLKQLTTLNNARVAAIEWGPYEQFSFKGAKGEKVYGYIVKPGNWDGKSKLPVAFLIHGGPQGSFSDHFHYRWNPQAFAGQGYAAVMVDFHGSTGYGQKFTDSITGHWGDAPFEDLMKGLDHVLKTNPQLDAKRVFALGASYGGYMINWINGHTDRFRALVCHDGNLDEFMSYFDTEELWFPEWEHGGLPWEHPEEYRKISPSTYLKNWKTPELVIHGGKDYRVVDTQGMSTFTALQRKGIKSRFLYFPEENHWILKPQDGIVWHREVFAWMNEFK